MAPEVLWLNLVTDGWPAMALAVEAPERGVMARPPTPLGESLLGHDRGRAIVLRAAALTVLTLVPAYVLRDGGDEALADRAVGASVVLRMIGSAANADETPPWR